MGRGCKLTYLVPMSRDLLDSLDVIKSAAEEIRREQWSWESLREAHKLRWRLHGGYANPQRPSTTQSAEISGTHS